MARLENKILPILQDYQSALLLDYLKDFRDTFISRIVSRWLRAELMADIAGYRPKPLEQRLKRYFGEMSGLAEEYAAWHRKLAGSEITPARKDQFSKLIRELQSRFATAKSDCRKVVDYFPSVGDSPIATDAAQIDRRCEKSSAARQIGLAIDHYMRSKEFRDLLRPPPESNLASEFHLIALFSIVPFKVDYPDNGVPLVKDDYEWKPGGAFRVLLPKEIVEDAGQIREFLPLLEDNKTELDGFHQQTAKMAQQSTFVLQEWQDAHTEDCCQPVKYLGTNCFVYTTAGNKCTVAEQYAETCLLSRNVNFVQLVPKPEELIRGFFQLQSPLPGFVKTLFPHNEFQEDWNHLVANGNIVVLGGPKITESAIVIEMPRSRDKWFEAWIEKGSAETPTEAIPPYCLELIYWIRRSVTPWSENFYQQLKNLDVMSSKLSVEITPLINEKYRQMLELLATPLGNLSNALGEMQRDTQELRAVLYDPSKALFHSAPLLADLFEEDKLINVSQHLRVMVSHQVTGYSVDAHNDSESPRKRRETKVNGRVILALALCRIYGCTEVLSSARKSQAAITLAAQELRDRATKSAFGDLTEDLEWLLGTTFWEKLENDDPSGALGNLKLALFDPFKLSARNWHPKVFALAALHYAADPSQFGESGDGEYTMPADWSPIAVHTALSFVMDICAEAHARRTGPREVKSIVFEKDSKPETEIGGVTTPATPATFFRIKCVFSGTYLKNRTEGEKRGWERLKTLIENHVLQADTRDWRISESRAGNFIKPYLDLSSRILGFGVDWTLMDSSARSAILFRIKNQSSTRSFSVSLNLPSPEKATEVWLSWEPITPQTDRSKT